MKVLCVLGTRPEAIKLAPVIRLLRRRPHIETFVCSTGQHRQMLDQVLGLFKLHINSDLQVMTHNQPLGGVTASILAGLDRLVNEVKPDWIVAQGDTTSVLAASLVAYYHRIGFAHAEAGLRTGNLYRPFPEEANRVIADLFAALLFAPTSYNRETLLRAGCPPERVHVTGNTVVDALHAIVEAPFDWARSPLSNFPEQARFVLITAHRRESFGEPFREICYALRDLADANPDIRFIYPVHLNPNVRRHAMEILAGRSSIHLIEPLDYQSFIQLMKRSLLVLTDSGGVQEEAPSLGVPVLIMREETERPEAVQAGTARLVGTAHTRIVEEANRLIQDEAARRAMVAATNPFGDGHAAERIVEALEHAGRIVC